MVTGDRFAQIAARVKRVGKEVRRRHRALSLRKLAAVDRVIAAVVLTTITTAAAGTAKKSHRFRDHCAIVELSADSVQRRVLHKAIKWSGRRRTVKVIELIVYPSQVARFSVGKRSIAVATASIDTRKAHFLQAWGHCSRLGVDTKKPAPWTKPRAGII